MSMLDERARQAAEAIEHSVADYRPPAGGFDAARRRHAAWAGAGWALAGATAAAAVVGAALLAPVEAPDVATTLSETTVATTEAPPVDTTLAPSPEPEVPLPVTELPSTTQATTTTLAPTTTIDATPPPLTVTSPADGAHLEQTIVTFSGETEPGATVVAGGKWPATVDAEGRWSVQLVLAPGANGASFVATDAAGNQTAARITVHYDAPEPTTTTKPPVEEGIEFTANATYFSCSESPPYDVYFGTADPGTVVTISSEYGSANVEVNGEGHWERKVHFETAPYGVTFPVTVMDHTGKTKQFEFVSWAE